MWGTVKIMVPFWVPIIIRGLIRGLILGTQKRDRNFDNPPCGFPNRDLGKCWGPLQAIPTMRMFDTLGEEPVSKTTQIATEVGISKN